LFRLADELDRIVVRQGDIKLFLYEGYDWVTTRKVIEDEVKKMKRRLTRIKQLVADGQAYDPSIDPINTLLFNSIHVGLDQDTDEMEPDALIAAIDEQLREDNDTASVSSWQSLRPTSSRRSTAPQPRLHGQRLARSRSPSIEIHLSGLFTETLKFVPNDKIVSRTFATVKDVEILDHVKTSTWRKFLTALRSDSRGNIRETGSDMVRIELRGVHPVPGNTLEETRLRVSLSILVAEPFEMVDFSRLKYYPFVSTLTKMHWTSSRSSSLSKIPTCLPSQSPKTKHTSVSFLCHTTPYINLMGRVGVSQNEQRFIPLY
jgi:autophagy-related protein 2